MPGQAVSSTIQLPSKMADLRSSIHQVWRWMNDVILKWHTLLVPFRSKIFSSVPSWLSLQFWPKTGHFAVKYMVQARKFRKDHEDTLCCLYFSLSKLLCSAEIVYLLQAVGEPHYPVAAAERGKKVRTASFEVADYDFTKFIPSVSWSHKK